MSSGKGNPLSRPHVVVLRKRCNLIKIIERKSRKKNEIDNKRYNDHTVPDLVATVPESRDDEAFYRWDEAALCRAHVPLELRRPRCVMSGDDSLHGLRINGLGSQKGGHICECGFHADTKDRWERHIDRCDLVRYVRTRAANSASARGASPLSSSCSANEALSSRSQQGSNGPRRVAAGCSSKGESRKGELRVVFYCC